RLALDPDVHRAGDVPHVEAATAAPVVLRLLGHHRVAARLDRLEVGRRARQRLGIGYAERRLGLVLGRDLAGREADQADVDRLALLEPADLAGGVAAAVAQQLHLVADLGTDVDRP